MAKELTHDDYNDIISGLCAKVEQASSASIIREVDRLYRLIGKVQKIQKNVQVESVKLMEKEVADGTKK